MKINTINTKHTTVGFQSLREDKKKIEQLKNGDKPLIENNKINILSALNNLSNMPQRNNIDFLLDIAENMAYGQGGENSDFQKALDEDGLTPSNRENTDWNELLRKTIENSLKASSDDVEDLKETAQRLFSTSKPLSKEQEEILNLRKDITNKVLSKNNDFDTETLTTITNIRKNLDYFVASSEIPYSQKQYCLKKMKYLLSDDYKINPQLEDKKINVLDEILTDIIIKTPEKDMMSIKDVDQMYTGMCAAISICRKLIAYEDKNLYIDTVLEELKDSDTISVYDITELGSGKKIDIPKVSVDYNTALRKGYRILDAAAHIWMQNGKSLGDNSIKKISYIPFDDENYGIFNDSFWYDELANEYPNESNLLRSLIVERKNLKSIVEKKNKIKNVSHNIRGIKNNAIDKQENAIKILNRTFEEIFPEKTDRDRTKLINDIFDFYKNNNSGNELNISQRMPQELKENILLNFIINNVQDITDEQKDKLNKNSKKIFDFTSFYIDAEKEIDKLLSYNDIKSKYAYNKNLFKTAAAHRVAVELDLDVTDMQNIYERKFNVPNRNQQISNYLNSFLRTVNNSSNEQKFIIPSGKLLSKTDIESELNNDIYKIQKYIPYELNSIIQTLYDKNVSDYLQEILQYYIKNIQNGDENSYKDIKFLSTDCKNKNDAIKLLTKYHDSIKASPNLNSDSVLNCIQFLGYESEFQVVHGILSGLYINGINEEEFERFSEKFGGQENVERELNNLVNKYNKIASEYNSIINKWNIPDASYFVLNAMEKNNFITSRKKLDLLKDKFDNIEVLSKKNEEEISDLKQRDKANDKNYKFSKVEQEILDSIDKSVSSMRRYNKSRLTEMYKALKPELDKEYSDIGMLAGMFYMPEEGNTGLFHQNQLRVLEQITGKPYHTEDYPENISKSIKAGNSSGILNMSVTEDDFGFHAQYIPAITNETFINPKTKEKQTKEIIWTDNSWGPIEKDSYYNGQDGFYYTDYGKNYGIGQGFILHPDYRIGVESKSLSEAMGKSKEEDFAILSNVILQGQSEKTNVKLLKTLNKLIYPDASIAAFNEIENALISGKSLDFKKAEEVDNVSEDYEDKLLNRIKKEIKSRKDYDALAKDDELRFILDKLSAYLSTNNEEIKTGIVTALNNDELQEEIDEMYYSEIDSIKALVGKGDEFLEKIYLTSNTEFLELLDEIKNQYNIDLTPNDISKIIQNIFLHDSSKTEIDGSRTSTEEYYVQRIIDVAEDVFKDDNVAEYFATKASQIVLNKIDDLLNIDINDTNAIDTKKLLAIIDKYLNPKSDEEVINFIKGLQYSKNDIVNSLFEKVNEEDLNITYKDPYFLITKIKDYDSSVMNALGEVIVNSIPEISKLNLLESKYRELNISLSNLDIQKYISKYKDEAFRRFKVRPAFPAPVIIQEQSLVELVNEFLTSLAEDLDIIENNEGKYNIIRQFEKIESLYSSDKYFNDILNRQDIIIDENSKEFIDKFTKDLDTLYKSTQKDENLDTINNNLEKLITTLKSAKSQLDVRQAGANLSVLLSQFNELKEANLTSDALKSIRKNNIKKVNSNINKLIKSNLPEKYVNDGIMMLKNLVKAYNSYIDEDELAKMQNDFKTFFIKHHIINDPQQLLKDCVELLKNGQQQSVEYKTKKSYLLKALRIANQTDIQYKLIKNQHEGTPSKMKSIMPLFQIITDDGLKHNLDSDVGLVYLIQELTNYNDNNTTLNLFLNMTGTTKKAFNAQYKRLDFDNAKNTVKNIEKDAYSDIEDIILIDKLINQFKEQNSNQYKDFYEALEHLKIYSKSKLKDKKDSPVVKTYLDCLEPNAIRKDIQSTTPAAIRATLHNFQINILENLIEYIGDNRAQLQEVYNFYINKANLLKSINIEEGSEEELKLQEIDEKLKDLCSFIDNIDNEIIDKVNSTEIIKISKVPS